MLALILAAVASYSIQVPAVTAAPPLQASISQGWTSAAHVALEHELSLRQGIRDEKTDVYTEADAKAIYVAFVCHQHAPIVAEQRTNSSGAENDDHVVLRLWPGGETGVAYTFSANANGTHDQSSSENTGFAPRWDSAGSVADGGYTVVMRIPRDILHGDGRTDWRIQFVRVVRKESLRLVWSWDDAMSYPGEAIYAGYARGIGEHAGSAVRPRARFQPFFLAQSNAARTGGSASRVGLDFSIPVPEFIFLRDAASRLFRS